MHLGTRLLAAVRAHVRTHAYKRTGILNEYVCAPEEQRRKMNCSVVEHTVSLSPPVKAE